MPRKRNRQPRYDLPTAVQPDSDWERWEQVAADMADQSRQCVEILACVQGQCVSLGRVCPTEVSHDATGNVADDVRVAGSDV